MTWTTGGILTNPATDAIVADTGAYVGGQTQITAVIASTVASILIVEHRNAANTANINSQAVIVSANETYVLQIPGVSLAPNERFRVRLFAGITGSLQASLFYF
jgi:hypothetical protein